MRPYLRVANVFEDRIDLSDVMQMNFTPAEAERFLLAPGDILLNEGQSKELVGRPAMYRGELPGACFTNSLVRFRARSCLDSGYALQLFRHYLKSGAFQRIGTITTNIAHLGAGRFADMDFPLPPLNEQRRIVAKLEDLLARSRRAKDALEAIPPLLEKLRQSILAAAFRGDLTSDWRAKNPLVEPAQKLLERIRLERRKKWEETEIEKLKAKGKVPADERWKAKFQEPEPVDASGLPEVPDGWCWASGAEIVDDGADIVYGIVQPGPEVDGGVPYVRGMDIQDGKIVVAQLKRTHPEIAQRYERAALKGGDVLLGIIRATKVAVVPAELVGANITQGTARFRAGPAISTPVLAAWLESPWAQAWLHSHYRGIDMPGLNLQDVRRLPLPVPPLLEQGAIASELTELRAKTESLSRLFQTVGQRQPKFDPALLAKAFCGELIEQDPNDEPASAMLERLAAERATAEPAKPKRAEPKHGRKAR